MFDRATHAEPAHQFNAAWVDLELLERQTLALEDIAARFRALPKSMLDLPVDLQPQYALAKRRLLEEPV